MKSDKDRRDHHETGQEVDTVQQIKMVERDAFMKMETIDRQIAHRKDLPGTRAREAGVCSQIRQTHAQFQNPNLQMSLTETMHRSRSATWSTARLTRVLQKPEEKAAPSEAKVVSEPQHDLAREVLHDYGERQQPYAKVVSESQHGLAREVLPESGSRLPSASGTLTREGARSHGH